VFANEGLVARYITFAQLRVPDVPQARIGSIIRAVNRQIRRVVLEEIENVRKFRFVTGAGISFRACLPPHDQDERPDARPSRFFCHIPWPNAEAS